VNRHRLAEARSIALHRAVVAKLESEPRILERARARVACWRATGTVALAYVEAWERLLGLDLGSLREALVDESEAAHAMRQASPFAGALTPPERWRIWRACTAGETGSGRPTPGPEPP
jgi:hypothetical protein